VVEFKLKLDIEWRVLSNKELSISRPKVASFFNYEMRINGTVYVSKSNKYIAEMEREMIWAKLGNNI